MKGKEAVIKKKSKKVVCVQKPKQYFFTIPHCNRGSVGGYCIIKFNKTLTNVKSCKTIHLSTKKKKL